MSKPMQPWCGALDAGERVLEPVRRFETPLADTIAPMRYVDRQRTSDGFFPGGRRHYWKAGWQRRLTGTLQNPRAIRPFGF